MAIKHGVTVTEEPTSLVAVREADSAIPMYVGAAPINQIYTKEEVQAGAGLEPVLVESFADGVRKLGFAEAQDGIFGFGLSAAMDAHFRVVGTGPIVLVNVVGSGQINPDTETITLQGGEAVIPDPSAFVETVVVKSEDGNTTYDEGTDYELEWDRGKIVLSRVSGGQIDADATVKVEYDELTPEDLTPSDFLGDAIEGTGFEAIHKIYPRFQRVVGIIGAPQLIDLDDKPIYASEHPTIAAAMRLKTRNINGVFSAVSYVDIGSREPESTEIIALKGENSINGTHEYAVWGQPVLGEDVYAGSIYAAAVTGRTDEEWGGTPHKSPSNEVVAMNRLVVFDPATTFPLKEIDNDLLNTDPLNQVGIATFLRWEGAFHLWGNRLASAQTSADVKEIFLNVRRMLNWIGNSAIITFFANVDDPTNLTMIQTITQSVSQWLNGLVARGSLIKGEVEFTQVDNPIDQLLQGHTIIRLLVTIPTPMENLEFKLEFDPTGFAELFA